MVIQYFPMYNSIKEQEKEQPIVWTHVTVRAFQLSSLLTPPVYLLSRLFKVRPSYGRIVAWTTGVSLAISYYIAYDNLEHPKKTEKNQLIAYNLQRDRKLLFREDWTLYGMGLGATLGLFFPKLAIHSCALSGSFLGFYVSWTMAEIKEKEKESQGFFSFIRIGSQKKTKKKHKEKSKDKVELKPKEKSNETIHLK